MLQVMDVHHQCNELLEKFENALRRRNPILAERLETGLPERRIRRLLQRARVESVVELFAWKNGSRLDPTVSEQHQSPFQDSDYIYMDLELILAHFVGFREGALYHPRVEKLVDCYFPVFLDGSGSYLAVDLHADQHTSVVRINTDS